ncbi:MAG: hypothetical protein L0229_25815 [Blastocatellia bacterium]|nr:hypothetical protein [Blastocatellia bacterium]
MLETLNRYVEEPSLEDVPLTASWGVYGRDRRFPSILMFSVISHLIFYVLILQLDWWVLKQNEANQPQTVALVKVAELAPPLEPSPLRHAPETLDRADLKKMEYDPDRANDVNLISRSRTPGAKRETSPLPEPPKPEAARPPSLPPISAIVPIDRNRVPTPGAPEIARTDSPPNAPAPAASSPDPNANAVTPANESPSQGSAQRGEGDGAKALGFELVQGQYLAYVRKKIRDTNERIMPRDLIKDMLVHTVSADFELQIGRGGRVLLASLYRSTGYSSLDKIAREAISIASPFEGYPPGADEKIVVTVTVYYTPKW